MRLDVATMTRGTRAFEAYTCDGFVRVTGVLTRDEVVAMRSSLLATLEAKGVGGERLTEVLGALRPARGTDGILWEVGRQPAFAPLAPALQEAVDAVFGPGVWATTPQGGLAAPNFPLPGVWSVPHQAWHVDEPTTLGRTNSWGLLGFALLDEVEPCGGATVMIAGSHRRLLALADELAKPSKGGPLTTDETIAALALAEPWFEDLFRPGDPAERRRRFMVEGHVSAGVALRVVELTGAPGDIVLMDPRCLHTMSANVSSRARLHMRMVCVPQALTPAR
jgi:hypothetical protein